jgi:hypothetical protein
MVAQAVCCSVGASKEVGMQGCQPFLGDFCLSARQNMLF